MPTDPFKQVKAYFSPGRDALEVTTGFIQNTKKTLDVAIFSLTHSQIVGALLAAHGRGVKGGDGGPIRILTDKDQMTGKAQQDAVHALSVAGLDVRIDTESGYFHNKYAISDYKHRGAAAICGSYNWSARATERNRESLVRIRIKAVIEQFHQNFEEVWKANGTIRTLGPLPSVPEVNSRG